MTRKSEPGIDPSGLPEIPGPLKKTVAGEDSDFTSTELSKFRTRMSEHRTTLSDVRSHMANERTYLALLRTAVSLMSFGITLNRFSIYLQEEKRAPANTGDALPLGLGTHIGELRDMETMGIGMVWVGMALLGWALFRYHEVYKQIEELRFTPPKGAINILTVLIIILGALSTLWMIIG